MHLNQTIITRLLAVSQIYKLVSAVIAPVAILAAIIWLLVFLVKTMVLGLQLLTSAWSEANALVASMPALHFLLLLALVCAVFVASRKCVLFALKGGYHV